MTDTTLSTCARAFIACCQARDQAVLIKRLNRTDKEFHFQNWVDQRLDDAGLVHDSPGRNSYPDFTLVHCAEGYEVKGLGWPGREASYDSNSRVPTGLHNDRTIYYVFGRYPAVSDDSEYPVVDLVLCHGDFLNADHTYEHKNRSFKGFGSYGDLLVRDRKMYVAPTPFALTEGTTGQATLIAPASLDLREDRIEPVGDLVRVETEYVVAAYIFDMRTNRLLPEKVHNPTAGREHRFTAYRMRGVGSGVVRMRSLSLAHAEVNVDNGGDDG